ncbi:MAG: TRAP transporter small permease [Thermoanaerobaculia bacterium]
MLLALLLLPLTESFLRTVFSSGLPGAAPFAQHLTLWVALVGGALAAREGKLLSLAGGELLGEGRWGRAARVGSAAVAAAVSRLLARASWQVMLIDRSAGTELAAGVPVWWAQVVLPLGFLAIALRLVWKASGMWAGRLGAGLGLVVGGLLSQFPAVARRRTGLARSRPLVVLATAAADRIFAAPRRRWACVLLFLSDGVPDRRGAGGDLPARRVADPAVDSALHAHRLRARRGRRLRAAPAGLLRAFSSAGFLAGCWR